MMGADQGELLAVKVASGRGRNVQGKRQTVLSSQREARWQQIKAVAVIGANGAGKTTTLRAISNLLKGERGEVTKGSIELRGERIEKLTPADLVQRGVVQVMEGRHCFAHLTIEENLLTGAYTRSDKGEMIQLDNLITLEENVAPPQLYHYNRFLSATVSAGLAKGKTIGQGLDEMDRIAEQTLGDDFRTALAGDSKEFRESSDSLMFAMILALLMIFLVLAAQFESFKDPFIVMITVPLALAGGLLFMMLRGVAMKIFSQIGMIMLIGLVAKNAIMIVDFANMRKAAGASTHDALIQANHARLRPILMTTIAMIFGMLPIALAKGAGAEMNNGLAWVVIGGLTSSLFLTLIIVPVVYSLFDSLLRRMGKHEKVDYEAEMQAEYVHEELSEDGFTPKHKV